MASINLLPVEFRQDLPIEWSKLFPKLILLGLISFILIFSLVFLIIIFTLNLNISNLNAELLELQPQKKQALELKNEINIITKQVSVLKELEEKQSSWNNLLWEFNERTPLDLWLLSLNVSPEEIISVKGQSLDFNSIGLFLNQLNQSKLITETQLLRVETLGIEEETVYSFEFQAKLDKGRGR